MTLLLVAILVGYPCLCEYQQEMKPGKQL